MFCLQRNRSVKYGAVMKTRSISGEHNFDLSSPSLDEVDEDGEDRHDTEKMSRADILKALKQMEEVGD